MTGPRVKPAKGMPASEGWRFVEASDPGLVEALWAAAFQLDGEPVEIPLEALDRRRPRSTRATIEGVEFFRLRLYRVEDLAAPEVETA